jgi:peptide/nickel transport system permease protein
MTTQTASSSSTFGNRLRGRWQNIRNSPRLSPALVAGLLIIFAVFMFGLLGPLFVDMEQAEVASVAPKQHPGSEYWLGTDSQGRSILAVMISGTPQTLKIGLIAGTVGIVVGLFLGMVAGFFGGYIDATIRVISDALLTVPAIAILIIIASNVDEMSVELMGITVAVLAWMFPTRTIRAQVLTIKERAYMEVARVNGQSGLGLVFREVMPNLLPFIMASFVGAVGSAMLAAVGLEALGLGANQVHTLGTIIYWAQKFSAVLRGQWWWWGPPIVMIAIIFMGLFLLSIGLDRFANPRLRQRT